MSQKSEPVFIVQRRRIGFDGGRTPCTPGKYRNVKVADDRQDARDYVNRMNKVAKVYEYRVDPDRSVKL